MAKVNWLKIAKNRRIQLVLLCVVLAIALIWVKGLNTGIEFSGGVRIPITLGHSVDATTMDSMVQTIKGRINKFGLSQSNVQSVGDNEILVEIPNASSDAIDSVRSILSQQGRFEAIIDGQDALVGSDVLSGAVGGSNQESVTKTAGGMQWSLGFAVSSDGGQRFSSAALGKGNYPVYMFLDRPQSALVIARKSTILPNSTLSFNQQGSQAAVSDSLRKAGDDITLLYAENAGNLTIPQNITTIIVEDGVEQAYPAIAAAIKARNVTVENYSTADMTPSYYTRQAAAVGSSNAITVASWTAIGLINSPALSPDLADGQVSQLFSVTGPASGSTADQQEQSGLLDIRELKSVISGGKLPVSTSIGSSLSVSPTLGEAFLQYSWFALLFGMFAVSLLIYLRYRRMALVIPVVFFNGVEVLLTTAIIGVFGTLDLSSMAGIIVLMGSGVADQILIVDEMLRKGNVEQEEEPHDEYEAKERVKKAFYIIFTVAGVVIAAMLPLILSGIVEIEGFGVSAVIGVLVGVIITRPAFGDLMKEIFQKRA